MDWSVRVSGPVVAARSHAPDAERCWAIVVTFARHGPGPLSLDWCTLYPAGEGDHRAGPVSWIRTFRVPTQAPVEEPTPLPLEAFVGGFDSAPIHWTDPGPFLVDVSGIPAGRYRVDLGPHLTTEIDVDPPSPAPTPDAVPWRTPTLATASDGVRLVGVDPDPQWPAFVASLPSRDKTWSFALVILRRGDDVLLVHDRWRDQWELPGGSREGDETPEETARRELHEETGHRAEHLEFTAVVTLAKGPAGRRKRGFVHTAVLDGAGDDRGPSDLTFTPTAEIDAVRWWNGTDDGVPGPVDAAIVRAVSAW